MDKYLDYFKKHYVSCFIFTAVFIIILVLIITFANRGTFSLEDDTTNISLECPQTVLPTESVTCDLYLNVYGGDKILSVNANYNYEIDSITDISFTTDTDSGWQELANTDNGFAVANTEGYTSRVKVGSLTFRFVNSEMASGSYSLALLTSVELVDDNNIDEIVSLDDTVASFEVVDEEPSTSQPSTNQPSTSAPSTSQPSTNEPSTSQPSTNEPSTSAPSTSQPSTTEYLDFDASLVKDDNKMIIKRLLLGTTFGELASKIDTNGTITFKHDDDTDASANEIIVSGSKIVITLSDATYTYKLSVLGNLTVNETVDFSDVIVLYRYFRGRVNLSDEYIASCDIDGDDVVDFSDVIILYRYFRGKIETLEEFL